DKNKVSGVALDSYSVALGEIASDTEVEFSNLFSGKVTYGSDIVVPISFKLNGQPISPDAMVKQAIDAPFNVVFKDVNDSKANPKVADVNGQGYYATVWIQTLKGVDMLKDLKIAVYPTDNTVAYTRWDDNSAEYAPVNPQVISNVWVNRRLI